MVLRIHSWISISTYPWQSRSFESGLDDWGVEVDSDQGVLTDARVVNVETVANGWNVFVTDVHQVVRPKIWKQKEETIGTLIKNKLNNNNLVNYKWLVKMLLYIFNTKYVLKQKVSFAVTLKVMVSILNWKS